MKRKTQKNELLFITVFLIISVLSGCKLNSNDKNPDPGPVTVSPSPAATPVLMQPTPIITPAPTPEVTKKDVKVKGLYLTGWTAGSKDKMDHFISLAKETELNAFVIDIKNDDGIVSYESGVPAVKEAGTFIKKFNPDTLIQTLHDNDIYVIGRVVCFRDPAFSKKYPERAVKTTGGKLWKEEKKDAEITWLNPYDRENWSYVIDIAKEAAEKGFDEIQFDYVRFPYGDRSKMDFGAADFVKHEIINEFLSLARKEMPDVTISADIFGIVCVSPEDTEDIGQYLELIGMDLDYISPMAYPALYAKGQIVNGVKFPKPDLNPYEVVYNTLLMARDRLSKTENYRADIRPFIQAFTASWLDPGIYQKYGAEQYRQQIQAVYDAGYEQWIFWDANNRYEPTAFLKESE